MHSPVCGHQFYNDLQIEHILPQSPKNGSIPLEFLSEEEYYSYVYRLGNVTLIESMINQAVNNYNDLSTDQWFYDKQSEYGKSSVCLTKLLDSKFYIGVNTALNRFKMISNTILPVGTSRLLRRGKNIIGVGVRYVEN